MEKRSYDHANTPVDPQDREAFQAIQNSNEGLVGGIRDGEAVVQSC